MICGIIWAPRGDKMVNEKIMDSLLKKLQENKLKVARNSMAVLMTTALSVTTLVGCSTNQNSSDYENPKTENITEENITKEETVTTPEEDTIKDNKSAVITSINIVKDKAEDLKELKDDVTHSEEYASGLKQSTGEIDALYRFIMFGETYEGTTFEELPTADKIDTIDGIFSLMDIVTTVEPTFEEDFANKKDEIMEKCKEIIDKYGPWLRDKIVKGGAKVYNGASDLKDYLLDLGGDIKDEAAKQR